MIKYTIIKASSIVFKKAVLQTTSSTITAPQTTSSTAKHYVSR